MIEFLVLIVCVFSSIIGAISGIGGGIVIRPVLEMATSYGVGLVSFLSGCTVLSMAIVTLLRRRKQIEFDYRKGTMLAIGSAFGGVAGKLIFDFFPKESLGSIQALLLIIITFVLLIHLCLKKYFHPKNLKNHVLCVALGLILGLLSAFLGIGGGPLNLAVLNYFLGMDLKKASIYSIYIILFSQIASFLLMLIVGSTPVFSWSVLACAIAGGVGGGFAGSWIGNRIREKALGYLYMAVLVFVLVVSGINWLSYL